jgi:hypothetical protein
MMQSTQSSVKSAEPGSPVIPGELALFAGFLLWPTLIWPFAIAVWHHLRGKQRPGR